MKVKSVEQKCTGCDGHGLVGGLLPNGGGYDVDECPYCHGSGMEIEVKPQVLPEGLANE
ncbi:hypothetical protein [Pectobacterium parmentieri]|uniref:hypothetical protein n=1 Tax=Pectobacterium parmentieri TaxID=1905730 RepID=UPI0015E7F509|nr:hypothetical protein [Pectobacterium parmentieri]